MNDQNSMDIFYTDDVTMWLPIPSTTNKPSKSVTVGPSRFIDLNNSAGPILIMKIYFNTLGKMHQEMHFF